MSHVIVSIIVPAYNAQKTINKCIQSLLMLDFPKDQYEIIVVDNNSNDSTAELIKSHPHVIYVKESIQGRSYARNTGAKISKGELLAFIDADVFLEEAWLTHMVASFKKISIGGGQGRIIPSNEDGQIALNNFRIRQQNEATGNTNIILRLMYAESPMVNSAACMYRKEAFNFVGGFDVLLERHEDIDLAKRVCVAGYDLVVVSEARAYVEYHGEGWWSYFIRSFSEGYTKQSYNSKWSQYFANISATAVSVPATSVSEEKNEKNLAFSALKLNLHMVTDEIFFNALRAIISLDTYYFLKALNASFKASGRIWGILKNDYPGNFVATYKKDLLDRSIFLKNDVEVKIDENIRFVVHHDEILYALNIHKNEIINFNNFQTFRKILNNRMSSNQFRINE